MANSEQEQHHGWAPDVDARSPLGVGVSSTTGGEEYAGEGEQRTRGTKGESERPYGDRDPDQEAGVDPSHPIDPESPDMPPA